MGRMNGLMLLGVVLVVGGLLKLKIPVFTTQKTEDVAKIGELKIQTTEDTSHRIPPLLSGGVLALGVILIGVSVYQKR
jgi:hypothetical protein